MSTNTTSSDLGIIAILCITTMVCVGQCNMSTDHEKEMIELEKEKLRLQIQIHKLNLRK